MRLSEIDSLPKYDDKAFRAARKIKPLVLSQDQKNALHWYKDGGYEPINTVLRGNSLEAGMGDHDQMRDDYGFTMDPEDAIRHIGDATASAPRRTKPLVVFRGESSRARAEALLAMEPGASYVVPTFLSTSLGASLAFYAHAMKAGVSVLSMISVPPEVRGAYISNSHDPDEHAELEFLIEHGTRLTLREKRVIPNANRNYKGENITLLVFDASPGAGTREAPKP